MSEFIETIKKIYDEYKDDLKRPEYVNTIEEILKIDGIIPWFKNKISSLSAWRDAHKELPCI